MPNYQTDFDGFTKDEGCLFFVLIKMPEDKFGQELSHLKVSNLIHVLHYKVPCFYNKNKPVLSDEVVESLPGIFVWDHETVVNQALLFMNILDWEIKYIGKLYTKTEEARGKISFGTHIGADNLILQTQTINGGHFRKLDYDPWKPGTITKYIKSVRYYKWLKI